MHTTCPECSSVFRISAEHLSMAHGQVRCGFCHTVFDALSHLEEDWKEQLPTFEPEPEQQPESSQKVAASTEIEQQLIESENLPLPDELEGRDAPPDVYEDHRDIPLDEIIAQESGEEPSALSQLHALDDTPLENQLGERTQVMVKHLQNKISLSLQNESCQDPQLDGDTPAFFQAEEAAFEQDAKPLMNEEPVDITYPENDSPDMIGDATMQNAPPILREELAAAQQEPEQSHTVLWASGIIMLTALLLLQSAYFFRNDLAKNDSLRVAIQGLCKIMSCTIPLRNDANEGIKTMKMVSHSIANIPEHPDQLRIRAIFTNTAPYTQSYPVLSIRLSDETGKTTAMRYLRPQKYLARHINIEQGLQAGTAVEIILDFLKPKHEVLSYRFDFL